MNATEILMSEHRVIEQTLHALEKIVDAIPAGERIHVDSARDAISFFRHFADGCHHRKEEKHLFPLLEARGMADHGGPTAVMRDEHEIGRHLLSKMRDALNRDAAIEFARHARTFIDLLRTHIQKEDHCLFPMAGRLLSQGDQQQLVRDFDYLEKEDVLEGTHAGYIEIANQLARRYGVPVAPESVPCGHSCASQGYRE